MKRFVKKLFAFSPITFAKHFELFSHVNMEAKAGAEKKEVTKTN